MLNSIDVKFIFYSARFYWVSLEDKGLFSSANILQITKKTVYIFFEYSLNANFSPA